MSFTLQQLVDFTTEARQAYHDLLTGNKAVEITDQNRQRVIFARADANKLYAYIKDLEAQISAYSDPSLAPRPGPVGFTF